MHDTSEPHLDVNKKAKDKPQTAKFPVAWCGTPNERKDMDMKLKIEYVNKEELKPYANNAKIHTSEQVEQIKKSIAEFGFNDPIALWHENEVIEGHGRLLAAMEMEDVKKVPVIRLDDLTDEQRKAYMLVHNKLTMNTDFDFDMLNVELEGITDIDMSEYGFNDIEVPTFDEAPEEFKEYGEDIETKNKCPKCGYEW